jgi:hypothetical protein
MRILELTTLVVVSAAMSLPLAHALEWPGKRRLDREPYRAVQTIYYPGFTFAGFSEPLAIVLLATLAWATPFDSTDVPWIAIALLFIVAMHAVYWTVTHPINKFWLENVDLNRLGTTFFGMNISARTDHDSTDQERWLRLRDRWESSHMVRAVLGVIALIAIGTAMSR